MKHISFILLLWAGISLSSGIQAQDFLRRSLNDVRESQSDLTTATAHYKAFFGAGDQDNAMLKGIKRYGHLIVNPGGTSQIVSYPREEQIYFIKEGTGILHYGKKQIPVSKNDFVYLPVGLKHGLSNPRERDMEVIVMGYPVPADSVIKPTESVMIASANDVQLQVVGNHPPSTKFKLMIGTIISKRDRLSAAYQVNSLFIMDFAAGGTNKPHRHNSEEEIYYVLRGTGEMVAGGSTEKENRHMAKEGDAFFFPANTLVGFYSDSTQCVEHALILAVRSKLPK